MIISSIEIFVFPLLAGFLESLLGLGGDYLYVGITSIVFIILIICFLLGKRE